LSIPTIADPDPGVAGTIYYLLVAVVATGTVVGFEQMKKLY